jgi:hypothetical protein
VATLIGGTGVRLECLPACLPACLQVEGTVAKTTRTRKRAPADRPRPHRLAVVIVKAVKGPTVIRTLDDWSEPADAAPSTLRMWCRACKLHPRHVVAFVRALWAIHHAALTGDDPVDLLDFADERPSNRFLESSGPLGRASAVVSIPDFCRQQKFIEHHRIIRDVIDLI